ncbi:hypothetical protein ADIS_0311 [Lunatimonas lonarensis]|uniref:Uncharacterized protein n=1 Tax=Lunatimonas lonarensis TaxID=1232681 RepID=R7ZYM6_9BACT|nr:hypothetical protein ADIS_0311 [Lunatimonas lonarensis]
MPRTFDFGRDAGYGAIVISLLCIPLMRRIKVVDAGTEMDTPETKLQLIWFWLDRRPNGDGILSKSIG